MLTEWERIMEYDESFYERNEKFQYELSKELTPFIFGVFPEINSILDVGCGCGFFSGKLGQLYDCEVLGINGDRPHNRTIEIMTFDLNKKFELNKKFDLVISLEVAEHIEEKNANNFIDTITGHGDIILFSAAVPGQGGVGHVNEQPHEYWHKKFDERSYGYTDIIRRHLANKKNVPFWYRENIFLYEKYSGVGVTK